MGIYPSGLTPNHLIIRYEWTKSSNPALYFVSNDQQLGNILIDKDGKAIEINDEWDKLSVTEFRIGVSVLSSTKIKISIGNLALTKFRFRLQGFLLYSKW